MSFSPSVNSFALSLSFWMFFFCLSHVSPHLFVFHTLRVFFFSFFMMLVFLFVFIFLYIFLILYRSSSISLGWNTLYSISHSSLLFLFLFLLLYFISLVSFFSLSLSPFLLTSSS
jgi:hypothetical protein